MRDDLCNADNILTLVTIATTNQLIVWRDSVCAGDDCDAPHEIVLTVGSESLRSVTRRLIARQYLAAIAGGLATWILQSGTRGNCSLAVLAQQWPEPRFLVNPDADVFSYIQSDANPHLNLRYWCQVDPTRVFECLVRGDPLPDQYGR